MCIRDSPGRLHHRPSEMRKIYVKGLGVISGIGKGVEEHLDSLKAGKHGMGKITLFPTALDVPVSEVKPVSYTHLSYESAVRRGATILA